MVDVEEELQAELVEEVHLGQGLDREVDGAAGGGLGRYCRDVFSMSAITWREMCICVFVYLCVYLVSLVHLVADLRRLRIQRLERIDHVVVVEDPALGLVMAGQQVLLEVAEKRIGRLSDFSLSMLGTDLSAIP